MADGMLPEFGIKRENEERRDGGCSVVFDPETRRYAAGKRAKDDLLILFAGGVSDGESIQDGVLREVTEESGLHDFLHVEKLAEALTHYHNLNKNVNRVAHATCFLVILKSANLVPTHLEAHEDFSLVWVTPQEIIEHWKSRNEGENYSHWIYFMEKGAARAKELGYDKT